MSTSGSEGFKRLVALLDCPMFVVTSEAGGHPSGCLVGFANQASIEPPRFLVALSKRNHTFGVAARSPHLAVHVLPKHATELARLFGAETGDHIDKFDRCAWHTGPDGMPILDDAAGWFVGKTLSRTDFGDHVGYLLEPVAGQAPHRLGDELVTLSDVADLDAGHEP